MTKFSVCRNYIPLYLVFFFTFFLLCSILRFNQYMKYFLFPCSLLLWEVDIKPERLKDRCKQKKRKKVEAGSWLGLPIVVLLTRVLLLWISPLAVVALSMHGSNGQRGKHVSIEPNTQNQISTIHDFACKKYKKEKEIY